MKRPEKPVRLAEADFDSGRESLQTYARVSDIEEFNAPWGRVIRLQEIEYTGGTVMLRVRIREGRRFTDLELTDDAARHLARALLGWTEARQGPSA